MKKVFSLKSCGLACYYQLHTCTIIMAPLNFNQNPFMTNKTFQTWCFYLVGMAHGSLLAATG